MDAFTVRSGAGAYVVEGRVLPLGDDLLVVLSGGERHIGAIGMAEPRPSMRDPLRTSSTSSVFTYRGHREDVIVKEISEFLSKEMGRRVVVVAGLHWKDLPPEAIAPVIEACRILAKKIVRKAGKA